MQFCLCGAQAGYPHSQACPGPLFTGSKEAIDRWERDYISRVSMLVAQGWTKDKRGQWHPPAIEKGDEL